MEGFHVLPCKTSLRDLRHCPNAPDKIAKLRLEEKGNAGLVEHRLSDDFVKANARDNAYQIISACDPSLKLL